MCKHVAEERLGVVHLGLAAADHQLEHALRQRHDVELRAGHRLHVVHVAVHHGELLCVDRDGDGAVLKLAALALRLPATAAFHVRVAWSCCHVRNERGAWHRLRRLHCAHSRALHHHHHAGLPSDAHVGVQRMAAMHQRAVRAATHGANAERVGRQLQGRLLHGQLRRCRRLVLQAVLPHHRRLARGGALHRACLGDAHDERAVRCACRVGQYMPHVECQDGLLRGGARCVPHKRGALRLVCGLVLHNDQLHNWPDGLKERQQLLFAETGGDVADK
mmetsp:Transcript_40111/g.119455  ORF Transcript_40111/g.119455 Transcript_40111/m.119455 type:complete len:276 (-) Transcript_40111:1017-1844(-)